MKELGLLGLGIIIGIVMVPDPQPYPTYCDYQPPPISWLQDEEGMPVAPRITLEPKPVNIKEAQR